MDPDDATKPDSAVMEKTPVTIKVTATRHPTLAEVEFKMDAQFKNGGGNQDKDKLKFNKKGGEFDLTFVLEDKTGLKLTFCDPIGAAIWVQKGEVCPKAAGYGEGVITPVDRSASQLIVGNANKISETLTFALRFDGIAEGAFQPPYPYDPKIINGGG